MQVTERCMLSPSPPKILASSPWSVINKVSFILLAARRWTTITVVVVQSLRRVWLFATPWTAAHQASLSCTISQSLLKLMSIESVMLSNHLVLCCPLLLLPSIFLSIRVFSTSTSGGQNIGASASLSVFAMNIHGWLPLGLPGLISFLFKGLSRVFSSTTVQKDQFFGTQPSLWPYSHICTWLLEKP